MRRPSSLVLTYIYIAVGSAALGAAITFALVALTQYYRIDLWEHLWLLAIPLVLSVSINILAVELYHKYKKK